MSESDNLLNEEELIQKYQQAIIGAENDTQLSNVLGDIIFCLEKGKISNTHSFVSYVSDKVKKWGGYRYPHQVAKMHQLCLG